MKHPDDDTPRIHVAPSVVLGVQTVNLRPPQPDGGRNGTILIQEDHPREPESAPVRNTQIDSDDLYSQYAIQGKVGVGGMGVVYLARDRRLNRHVAIKRLNQQSQRSESLKRRFLQEAKAVAALSHNNIVHIYSLGEDEEGPYIVMEYIEGPPAEGERADGAPPPPLSLEQRVRRDGRMTCDEAIDLIIKIARAVSYAHSCGIIHRDLKPANILLDKSDEPKIVDFGLARLATTEESQLTVPGEKLLSLGYGAPEQESDASISDERADVYGLGALLFFAITGQNPRYYREQLIPESLRETMARALATDRENRWPTVKVLVDALLDVRAPTTVELPTVKTTWRCKWCDTVNPLSIRYCAECGWDGGEGCAECGAPTHVGIPFCGNCGADAREYETAKNLRQRLKRSFDSRQFEQVLANEGRALAFEPVGPGGRDLVKELQSLRESAERSLARRAQLRELIPLELRAQNFERARSFITEYHELYEGDDEFADELKALPQRTLNRDLERAQRAVRKQEWEYAERICREIAASAPAGDTRCEALLAKLRRHRSLLWARRVALILGALGILYILVPAPLYRYRPFTPETMVCTVMRPAMAAYSLPVVKGPLGLYAGVWGITNDFERLLAEAVVVEVQPPVPTELSGIEELDQLRTEHDSALAAIEVDYKQQMSAWPVEYRRALEAAMERRQKAGDYEGWEAVEVELQAFSSESRVSEDHEEDPSELAALKGEYRDMQRKLESERARKLVSMSKKHLHHLGGLLSAYTKTGDMKTASLINDQIKLIRNSERLLAAENLLTRNDASTDMDDTATPATLPSAFEGQIGEIEPIQLEYGQALAAIESSYIEQLDTWPGKVISALEQLMAERMQEGDYVGWEAASFELERFEAERVIVVGDTTDIGPVLLALLQRQQTLLTEYEHTRARNIVAESEKAIGRLEQVQTAFTRAGEMERATAVNAEIRRLHHSPEVAAAYALLEAEAADEREELNPDRPTEEDSSVPSPSPAP